MSNLLDYFDEFTLELKQRLEADDKRWGTTWKKRDREGQIERFKLWVNDMFDQIENGNVNNEDCAQWELALAGNAFINWIRDKYPDTYGE